MSFDPQACRAVALTDRQDNNAPLTADANGTITAPASTSDSSILPIVTSQRDRFRQRNAELEEELRKQFEIVTDLRTEIKSLQADNLKLYEKVHQFVQGRGRTERIPGYGSEWRRQWRWIAGSDGHELWAEG
jgi:hypothetical protein